MTQPNYRRRRQRVFLVLSGIFLGTLALLNVLGISRFVDLSFDVFGVSIPMVVAIGVLPYPVTFMCTDLISELFGEKKARDMVWVGLLLNGWVVFLLWLGGALPGFEALDANGMPMLDEAGRMPVFFEIRELAFGYRVEVARDGKQGLVRARETDPAAIILDIELPGMDGYEVLKALQADATLRSVPVIVSSVHDEARERVKELGAREFLAKPVDRDALKTTLSKYRAPENSLALDVA